MENIKNIKKRNLFSFKKINNLHTNKKPEQVNNSSSQDKRNYNPAMLGVPVIQTVFKKKMERAVCNLDDIDENIRQVGHTNQSNSIKNELIEIINKKNNYPKLNNNYPKLNKNLLKYLPYFIK